MGFVVYVSKQNGKIKDYRIREIGVFGETWIFETIDETLEWIKNILLFKEKQIADMYKPGVGSFNSGTE